MVAKEQTPGDESIFDFDAYPSDTLFYDRRTGVDRREPDRQTPPPAKNRRKRTDRRKRVDPTTFEKQYTEDEIEFMNAMQRFKLQTGKTFPSYSEVLSVAYALGYRKMVVTPGPDLVGDGTLGEFEDDDEDEL